MVDTRFHPSAGPLSLVATFATLAGAPEIADPRFATLVIEGAEELDTAGPAHLSLATQASYRAALGETTAGVVIVHPSLVEFVPAHSLGIVSKRAHELFVDLLERLYPQGTRGFAPDGGAAGADPIIEEGVRLGANVVIGTDVEIGRNTVIGANTVIGRGVTIGRNAVIGPNVSLECAHLGNYVVVHAGARIGTEGFGWLDIGRSNRKIPQLGRVILQDRVEIGANTTVDRGALGDTVVGEGSKIDNLVQIGHNCRIGRNCLIAAHCGLAGSTVLEDSVLMGGGAASAGHLTIGRGAVLYARAATARDVAPGAVVAGSPAQDAKEWRRSIVAMRRLGKGDKSGRDN
jgi:UDP-3-O-[3-hydroxymyristoyl] glucosamine N-acyltransferase